MKLHISKVLIHNYSYCLVSNSNNSSIEKKKKQLKCNRWRDPSKLSILRRNNSKAIFFFFFNISKSPFLIQENLLFLCKKIFYTIIYYKNCFHSKSLSLPHYLYKIFFKSLFKYKCKQYFLRKKNPKFSI